RQLRQIKICISTGIPGKLDAVNTAGNAIFLEDVIGRLDDLVGHLIAAPNRGFPLAKPWYLPGKTNCGTEIVVVVLVPSLTGVRRVLSKEADARVCTANSGFHPVGEA